MHDFIRVYCLVFMILALPPLLPSTFELLRPLGVSVPSIHRESIDPIIISILHTIYAYFISLPGLSHSIIRIQGYVVATGVYSHLRTYFALTAYFNSYQRMVNI